MDSPPEHQRRQAAVPADGTQDFPRDHTVEQPDSVRGAQLEQHATSQQRAGPSTSTPGASTGPPLETPLPGHNRHQATAPADGTQNIPQNHTVEQPDSVRGDPDAPASTSISQQEGADLRPDGDPPANVGGDNATRNISAPSQSPSIIASPPPLPELEGSNADTLGNGYGIIRAVRDPSGTVIYYEDSTMRLIFDEDEYRERYGQLDFIVVRYHFGQRIEEGIRVLSQSLIEVIDSIRFYEGSPETDMVLRYWRNSVPASSSIGGPAGLWCDKTFLYHHHEALIGFAERHDRPALRALLCHLEDKSLLKPEFQVCRQEFAQRLVSATTAPYLFRPGQFAFAKMLRSSTVNSVVVVDKITWDSRLPLGIITCWNWWFEPDRLSRGEIRFTVNFPLRDTLNIRRLPLYPISVEPPDRSHPSGLSSMAGPERLLMEDFLATGQMVWNLIQEPTAVEYTGYDTKNRFYPSGTMFMVDYDMRRHEDPGNDNPQMLCRGFVDIIPGIPHTWQGSRTGNGHDPYPDHVELFSEPQNQLLLLMPPVIVACSLQDRAQTWCTIATQDITLPRWDPFALDELELSPSVKHEMEIFARKFRHTSDDHGSKPLFLHLHGEEGRDKTATISALAEMLGSLLLIPDICSVLSGDEGRFELATSFLNKAGARWPCVMLLDDADPLVKSASHRATMAGGSMASAMFRDRFRSFLESYPGIVIFVTRHDALPLEAYIQRRITDDIKYERPESDKSAIWLESLQRLEQRQTYGHTHIYVSTAILRSPYLDTLDSIQLQALMNTDRGKKLDWKQICDIITLASAHAARVHAQGPQDSWVTYLQFHHIMDAFDTLFPERLRDGEY